MMQVLNLVFGIFLSRLLTPADYGVVGALTIFSAIAGIFSESGFILAIVNKKQVDDADYNAVFWFNVVMSLAIYAGLWFGAPLIARFYGQPEMVALSRFIFIGFVASALSATPTAYFFRNLDVKTRSSVQIAALALSGVGGVIAAFSGLGYWSIAIQTVIYTFTNSGLLWWRCPWRPSFSFSGAALRALLPFSMKQLVVSLFTQINNNIFSVLLGRFYGMRVTGFYTQGNKWTAMGSGTLVGMLNGVGQPVLRQTVDDAERQLRVFRRLLRFTCILTFPAMFGLAICAREIIVLLITDKWLDSVAVMQILCIGAAFLPVSTLFGNLFNSAGRPGVYMWNVLTLGTLQTLLLCVTSQYGLTVMLALYSALNVAWAGVWLAVTKQLMKFRVRLMLTDILPPLVLALLTMGATWLLTEPISPLWLQLVARILVGGVLYILAVRLILPMDFKEALSFLRKK